jgi:translation initiation factor IF-2
MSSKLRVYEVARDLGLDSRDLVALFQQFGATDVKNHMSAVPPEALERVKRHLEKQKAQKAVEQRIHPTVVKRKATRPAAGEAESSPVTSAEPLSSPAASSVGLRQPAVVRPTPRKPPPVEPAPVIRQPEPVAPPPAALAETPPPVAPAVTPPPEPPVTAPEEPLPQPLMAEPVVAPEPLPEAEPIVALPQAAPVPAGLVAAEELPAVALPEPALHPAEPLRVEVPSPPPPAPAPAPSPPPPAVRPSQPPPRVSAPAKTGIDVWEGRPGVPMPQQPRGAPQPRRKTYDANQPTGLAARGRPGAPTGGARPQQRGGTRHRGIGSLAQKRTGPGQPVTQERSAHKKVVRIEESIGLQALGIRVGVKAQDLLRVLMTLGMQNVNINTTLDADTAKLVANEFGWEVEDVAVSEEDAIVAAQGGESEEEDAALKKSRPPVVTVMGHVDHGKTSLLDVVRKSNVVAGEAGGITQHIGAYSVDTPRGKITFLDTPGHEAFTAMRARGAQTTDVVILVVAADDGVMPQTVEALNHARSAKVPIVVAVNKCDKPEAQPERVRRELADKGLVPEEWGGDTIFVDVSAVKKQGIDSLLEAVALQAEVLELRANPDKPAVGVVVEAELDRGKGPVATVLVTEGTLRRGDSLLAGAAYGKVRAMLDDRGRNTNLAGPATPVSIIGLSDVPAAGDPVHVVKDIKIAEKIADKRKSSEKKSLSPTAPRAMSFDDLVRAMGTTDQLEVKLIIKADVQGSVEAIANALGKLSTDKVKVSVVNSAVGAITEGDVNLALAAGAIIIGFSVRPAGKAAALAQKEKIEIRVYEIIYNLLDDVRLVMEGLLAPKLVEKALGKAEVRQVFRVSKAGTIAGCMVTEGLVKRSGIVRLLRAGQQLWEGKIGSLKRFKEDAREVKEGFECGIALDGFAEVLEGDVISVFEIEEVRQTL